MKNSINFLLAGVGGQGTILASDVLVNVGLKAGYQTKQAEVHGMSQRGGSVTSHVRWGEVVHSPLIAAGEVDVLLAFEKLEALRNLKMIRPDALAVVNTQRIIPLTVTSGDLEYPDDERVRVAFARVTPHTVFIDGEGIADSLGNLKVANVVLLGALSALLEQESKTGENIPFKTWLEVICERVPKKHEELNRRAFQAGREAVKK